MYEDCFQDWIYKQICHSATPIHPLLPPLIEVFIGSIILPSTKTDRTNEPITEAEILTVFKDSVFIRHRSRSRSISRKKDEAMDVDQVEQVEGQFTAQVLLLYYILLYKDTALSNMKSIGKLGFRSYLSYY